MPCIITNGTYKVYVYFNDHGLPHCHVIWDGDTEGVVDLTTLSVTRGHPVSRAGLRFVKANREKLMEAWNRLNPARNEYEED